MTDTREAILFKKVSDGYVFRAPNPWLFGRGRFFLVNEAQKAQLLAILTARSQFANVMILITGFVVMYSASVAAIAFMTGHGEPSVGDTVMMVALAAVCMYAALLICVRPAARRVQPLLAGLAPTDQRITAADCRLAAWKTTPLSGQFMLAVSQVILSAMFFIQVMQKAGGNLASVFDNGSAFSSAFAGSCFAFSSTCLLVTALKRFARRQQETAPADRSFRKFLLPGFSLAISIAALGLVLYTGHVSKLAAQHRAKSFEISKRLAVLTQRIQDPSYSKRQVSIKTRLAANTARMNVLIGRLHHPTVKCEPVASSDDPVRQETARLCAERAWQEKQAVEAQIATTTKEAAALAKENEAIQKEVAAFKAELAQIRAEMEANRAEMVANGELRPTRSLN